MKPDYKNKFVLPGFFGFDDNSLQLYSIDEDEYKNANDDDKQKLLENGKLKYEQ